MTTSSRFERAIVKATIFLLLAASPALLHAQESKRQALAGEVDEYRRTVHEAAATFLNKQLSPAERIKAISPYPFLYDEKQVQQFKSVVLDNEERPEVRATALDKIIRVVPGDERLGKLVLEWLGNRGAPRALRAEALKVEADLSFSNPVVPEVYQKLLDDPEPQFRVFAFTKLIAHGDARAQQKLIQGLENPDAAALPGTTAIGILSMAPKKEFYPALYRVLQTTRDGPTRLEAIRALGFYPEARERLIAISRDAKEKEEFREAALAALYAGDRDNIIAYATPIVANPDTPPRLQGIAIQMTIDVRQATSWRAKAKTADEYDRLVQRLAREAADPEVRRIASKYVESVRPHY